MKKTLLSLTALLSLGLAFASVSCSDYDPAKAVNEKIRIVGVNLEPTAPQTINAGQTLTLRAAVVPEMADKQGVTWSSSNPAVATVSGRGYNSLEGLVTGVSNGTARITVRTVGQDVFEKYCDVTVIVPVAGVTLDKALTTIATGSTGNLTATISPSDATNQNVTWSSSNTAIATVTGSNNGAGLTATVRGVAIGQATITTKTADGGKTATCQVTVAVGIPVASVALNKTSTTIAAGSTETLTATISPSNAANQSVTWVSSNIAVATVTGSGLSATVRAVALGTATIAVTTADGGKMATCQITVGIPVASVSLNKTSITIAAGSTETLTATISPSNATNKYVTWTSNNTGIATVSGGTVTGVAAGTATITVTTQDGGKTATCAVTVGMPSIAKIFAGQDHSVALATDGSLWAWGWGGTGQIGDGTYTTRYSPVRVGTTADWRDVSAGYYHNIAIKTDGSLWAWGYNNYGQLGLGDNNYRSVPTQVGTARDWKAVAAGQYYTVAVKNDGSLWAWGYNYHGQLGLGDSGEGTNRNTPVRVGSANTWATVSAGENYTVATRTDNTLWAWGRNGNYQLGLGDHNNRSIPTQVGSARDWKSVVAGQDQTVAVKNDGSLWAWGGNYFGQLGDGTNTGRSAPAQVGSARDWKSVSAGQYHTLAIKNDNSLWAWGQNMYGQLGLGTDTSWRNAPVQVGDAKTWAAAAAGYGHTVAIRTDGSVWAWGFGEDGQLGIGNLNVWNAPAQVGTAKDWKSAAGYGHTVATKTDNSIWSWGDNGNGQLGDGTTTNRTTPTQVGTVKTWSSVSAGNNYTVATRTDNSLWAWGYNNSGQLGTGDNNYPNYPNAPVQVGTVRTWGSVSVGTFHTVALRTDNSLWAWGQNNYGQLGDGTTANKTTPVQVGAGWKAVDAGYYHTVAIKNDGTLWSWGVNDFGQLGIGTSGNNTNKNTPTRVGTANDWKFVAAGHDHTLAIKNDNSLWAWGNNGNGRLGDGSYMQRTTPVQVGTAKDWAAVSAGGNHTVAIKNDGSLWAWGQNDLGQLGDGTNTGRSAPVQVGTAKDWASVSAGDYHTVAIKNDGSLYSWGRNIYGQLGNGTYTGKSTPVQVTGSTVASAAWEQGQEIIHFGIGTSQAPPETPSAPSSSSPAARPESKYVSASGDIYEAGWEEQGDGFSVAKLWKNGIEQDLEINPDAIDSRAHAVYVSGNDDIDVYVAGYEYDGRAYRAVLWKNGSDLNWAANDALTFNSVFVHDGHVYAGGCFGLWKDDERVNLQSLDPGLDFGLDNTNTIISSVYVSDGIVYATGQCYDQSQGAWVAVLWKDGAAIRIGKNNH